MINSPQQAVDDMFQMVSDTMTEIETYLGYSVDRRWQGVEKENAPDVDKVWMRILRRELDETKDYVSSGDATKRNYTHVGILSIEIFGPTADLLSWDKINHCANIVKNKFKRPSPLGVTFLKSSVIDAPTEVKWYKVNVVVNYTYDEGN